MNNYTVDRQKWAQLTFLEQMGNISSEVGRAIQAKQRQDIPRQNAAIDRALDLINATAANQPFHRAKEILRARDEFLALFFADHQDSSAIVNYFNSFAIAARLNR